MRLRRSSPRTKKHDKINYMMEVESGELEKVDPFKDIRITKMNREAIKSTAQILVNTILRGATRTEIFAFVMNRFAVSVEIAQEVVNEVFDFIRQDVLLELENEADLAMARRNMIFRMAIEEGDLRTALEVEKDRSKMRGLYAKDETQKSNERLDRLVEAMISCAQTEGDEYETQALTYEEEIKAGIADAEGEDFIEAEVQEIEDQE